MNFQTFESLAHMGEAAYWAPGVALAAGGLVSSIWLLQRFRLGMEAAESSLPPAKYAPPPPAADLPAPQSETTLKPLIAPKPARFGDKRRSIRRGGNPTTVRINDALDGRVINRSRGGLCLESSVPFRVGQVISVRPTQFDPTALPVDVEIRHAQQRGEVWVHGCKFVVSPPWSILLQFG